MVVIGDHHIDTQSLGVGYLGRSGDAAVHRDDELHALLAQPVHCAAVQAVTLSGAVGNIAYNMSASLPQKFCEQTGGGDAIHIIVAVDGDGVPPFHGLGDADGGPVHIPHEKRVVEQLWAVGKKLPRLFRGVQPPGAQHNRTQRGYARQLQLPPGLIRAAPAQVPLFVFHIPCLEIEKLSFIISKK